MITVTKGQWFPITLGNIMYQGAAFNVSKAADISVSLVSVSDLGMKKNLTTKVSAFNELTCVEVGTVPAGKYDIEMTCKDEAGKNYRIRSAEPFLEISEATTLSYNKLNVMKIVGDNWELTADVEIHESAATTYMSLLEKARQESIKSTAEANTAIENLKNALAITNKTKAAADAATIKANTAVRTVEQYIDVVKKVVVNTSDATVNMDANKFYNIIIGTTLTLMMNAATDDTITNDWEGCFDTGDTLPTITWPENVNWGTSYMDIDKNTHYEFSIRQNGGLFYGILFSWALA